MASRALSHYRIIERLGGGGMGVVYRVEESKPGRFVTLKLLPRHPVKDRHGLEGFQHQARRPMIHPK